MFPFDGIGAEIGSLIATAFDEAMTAIWNASLDLLRASFIVADHFSVFSLSTTSGPIKVIWPMMLWIAAVMAMMLFFWQIIATNLRAGRGFVRLVVGPVQFGVALAVTVGVVATFLAGVDGLTDGVLNYGLQSKNFADAFSHTSFGDAAGHGVKAVVLGLCAIAGVVPAAIGYALEMLFREAAIYVLAATLPLVAAGLLADVTARWFWHTVRWLAAAIAMKPVLALALVLGVAIAGGSEGVAGLLAGVGVLVISLIAPFVLFRLFAFVDPNSDAGGAFRDFLSGAGVDSYGPNNPAAAAVSAAAGGGAMESANTGRFDQALAEQDEKQSDATGAGEAQTERLAADGGVGEAQADDGRQFGSGRDSSDEVEKADEPTSGSGDDEAADPQHADEGTDVAARRPDGSASETDSPDTEGGEDPPPPDARGETGGAPDPGGDNGPQHDGLHDSGPDVSGPDDGPSGGEAAGGAEEAG
jgi:hypothetical protein